MIYLWFVLVQSFGAEALVPNSTALVVQYLIAGGYDGGTGKEEVVERGFGASAARSVDFSHC